jgi:hypothetical protein
MTPAEREVLKEQVSLAINGVQVAPYLPLGVTAWTGDWCVVDHRYNPPRILHSPCSQTFALKRVRELQIAAVHRLLEEALS